MFPSYLTALCSWLQSLCYPGDCPGGHTSCNCTDGFAGLDCLESEWAALIDWLIRQIISFTGYTLCSTFIIYFILCFFLLVVIDDPDLNSCEVRITSPETLTSQCIINATQPTYINFIPTDLTAAWDTSFVVTSYPPRPAYVHSYGIGISQADVQTNVYRMNSCEWNRGMTDVHVYMINKQLISNIYKFREISFLCLFIISCLFIMHFQWIACVLCPSVNILILQFINNEIRVY